ncbi:MULTISPECIES: NAD-dependent epimerase/dehydratase family protein [unclassified Schlesneria]|uniref:NAD-dependent epimerase/dehydratase family protein n=1 Tax=Schlesneria TaxID=656899 RepID=UPI00359FC5A1
MTAKILVTGGCGFIGTWVLRELLSQGLSPIAFDLRRDDDRWQRILGSDAQRIPFVAGTLCDRELLSGLVKEHKVTHIIHLAALLTPQCQQNPYEGCEVNILGSVALFELARLNPGQVRGISYASSYAVYGPEADDAIQGMKAADNRPPSFYGAFKMAVDLIADQYWRHFQIASVGIRPHVVFGPERTVGLTAAPSQAVRAAVRGEPWSINYRGRVGYDYVEDVALAFVRSALETSPGSTIVDLPGPMATTEEFAAIIDRVIPGSGNQISVSGAAIPANIPPKPNYISSLFPDWQPTSIEEGVRRTADFYRKQIA